ncbi:hypothetical protein B9Z65_664 [Elsinoe australis]|uniref:COMPASS component SDC1 n=1 Tax=Elsinoe australis TaxID=40998 RepID=A0A2P8AJA5_9PEZI|nr:hypothetical protein B9Z65_664 [Elsinoe australis]
MAEGMPNGASSTRQDVVMQESRVLPTNGTAHPPDLAQTQNFPNETPAPAPAPGSTTPARPSSQPPTSIALPEKPAAHGSPTRVYLNQNITPHLLEGMKYLAAYEPEKPLKWLSEFLAKKSAELEGS